MKAMVLIILLLLSCCACHGQYSHADTTLSKAGFQLIRAKKAYVIGRTFIIISGGLLAVAGTIQLTGINNSLNDNLKFQLTVWGIITHAAGWFFNGRAWKHINKAGEIMYNPKLNIGQQNYGIGIGFVF